jgi:hypothetical protein
VAPARRPDRARRERGATSPSGKSTDGRQARGLPPVRRPVTMQSLCCRWWLHPAVDRAGHGPPLLVAEHRAIRVSCSGWTFSQGRGLSVGLPAG